MTDQHAQTAEAADEELLTVKEVADELGIAESTAWLLVSRHNLPRYRVPAKGKTTLIRRGDARRAYYTPRPIEATAPKKAAA